MNLKIAGSFLERHRLVKEKVKSLGGQVVFTSLIGSQNYGLDSNESDLDTFSFIFPSLKDFVCNTKPISNEYETDDGKYVIKDIRLGIQNLRKSNPNSMECFTTKYKIYEKNYCDVLTTYLNNENTLKQMLHASYQQMANSIAGMARMLHGRNMTIGKKYSHCLRLAALKDAYFDLSHNTSDYLMPPQVIVRLAREAKFNDYGEDRELFYWEESERIANELYFYANDLIITNDMQDYENKADTLITSFIMELFDKYLGSYKYYEN